LKNLANFSVRPVGREAGKVTAGAEPGLRYQNLYKGNDLVIAVAGADSGVAVTVDGTTVTDGVSFNDTHVVVGQNLLVSSLDRFISFRTSSARSCWQRSASTG